MCVSSCGILTAFLDSGTHLANLGHSSLEWTMAIGQVDLFEPINNTFVRQTKPFSVCNFQAFPSKFNFARSATSWASDNSYGRDRGVPEAWGWSYYGVLAPALGESSGSIRRTTHLIWTLAIQILHCWKEYQAPGEPQNINMTMLGPFNWVYPPLHYDKERRFQSGRNWAYGTRVRSALCRLGQFWLICLDSHPFHGPHNKLWSHTPRCRPFCAIDLFSHIRTLFEEFAYRAIWERLWTHKTIRTCM